jgi:hypothetical protein
MRWKGRRSTLLVKESTAMIRSLYENLLRSLYFAPSHVDGEFLGELAMPVDRHIDGMSGTLTVFPSTRAARIRADIRWHQEYIEELTDDLMDSGEYDSHDWEPEDTDEPTETVKIFWDMQENIEELERKLAAL